MLHVVALSWSLFALRQMEKAVQLVKRSANLGIRYLIDLFSLSKCLSLSFPVLSKHININSHQLATCWHGILCIFTFYLCLWWSNFMAANLSLLIMSIKANTLHCFLTCTPTYWRWQFLKGQPNMAGPFIKAVIGVSTTGFHDVLWLWFTWQMVELRLNQHVSHIHQGREDPSSHTFPSCFLGLFYRGCSGVLCVLIGGFKICLVLLLRLFCPYLCIWNQFNFTSKAVLRIFYSEILLI